MLYTNIHIRIIYEKRNATQHGTEIVSVDGSDAANFNDTLAIKPNVISSEMVERFSGIIVVNLSNMLLYAFVFAFASGGWMKLGGSKGHIGKLQSGHAEVKWEW